MSENPAEKMPLVPAVKMDSEDDRIDRQLRMQKRQQLLLSNATALESMKEAQLALVRLRAERLACSSGSAEAAALDLQIREYAEAMTATELSARKTIAHITAELAKPSMESMGDKS